MNNTIIDVAAAAIVDDQGRVLLALRQAHLHQGGKWEFPGGKFEHGETAEAALSRELHEELDITVKSYRPLISVLHHYLEKSVRLHVFLVSEFSGYPKGKEGQTLQWMEITNLRSLQFPDANYPIVRAVQLPSQLLITGAFKDYHYSPEKLIAALRAQCENGCRLIQLRLPDCDDSTYLDLVPAIQNALHELPVRLMLNRNPELIMPLANVGWHVSGDHVASAQQLLHKGVRPDWLSTSIHHESEWRERQALQPDFVLVSPVKPTTSHPDAMPIGWEGFSTLVKSINCPAFALGGMCEQDLPQAWKAGAQGIAGIRAFL